MTHIWLQRTDLLQVPNLRSEDPAVCPALVHDVIGGLCERIRTQHLPSADDRAVERFRSNAVCKDIRLPLLLPNVCGREDTLCAIAAETRETFTNKRHGFLQMLVPMS